MPNLTRDQLTRWNAKAKNGFRFDSRFYLTHGEKRLCKEIDLPDGRILRAVLEYTENRESLYSPKPNGQRPSLHLSVWTGRRNGFMSTSGLGAWISIGELQPKRNYNNLVKLTADYPDEAILALYQDHAAECRKESIL